MATRSGKQRPVSGGASFDLWKVGNEDGRIFAVKRLRVSQVGDPRYMKKVIQIGDSLCHCFLLESLPEILQMRCHLEANRTRKCSERRRCCT